MLARIKQTIGEGPTNAILAVILVFAGLVAFGLLLDLSVRFGTSDEVATQVALVVFLSAAAAWWGWENRDALVGAAIFLWPASLIGSVIGGFMAGGWGAVSGLVICYLLSVFAMALYLSR